MERFGKEEEVGEKFVCGDVWNFFVMSCDVIHVNMNMPGMT